jgi:hypothetical protein
MRTRGAEVDERIARAAGHPTAGLVQAPARDASANDISTASDAADMAIGALLPQARRLALSDTDMLRILTRDGPQTIAGLAQRLHLNVQTARYRIARLRQRGALQWGRSGGGAYLVSLTTAVASGRHEGSSAPSSRGEAPSQAGEVSAVKVRTVVVNGDLFDVVFSGRESLTPGAPGLGSTLSGRGFSVRL